mmetsp:Transcript_33987/g.82381  ORF Transcript_33987/g.82381 Transcript_33987/m.82381 type:complete len:254 (-) Transcript_33987:421-1182(-)
MDSKVSHPGAQSRPITRPKPSNPDVRQDSQPNKRARHEKPERTISSRPMDGKSRMKTGRQHGAETFRKLKPGVRIEVYWPMEKKNFSGTLVREDSPGQWLIRYDDGDLRLHALGNDNWQYRLPDDAATQSMQPAPSHPAGIWNEPMDPANPIEDEAVEMRGQYNSGDSLKHVSEGWGQRFERVKSEAIAEARILQGLIFHTKPQDPSSVDEIRSLTQQLRELTEYCATLHRRARRLPAMGPQVETRKSISPRE